MTDTAARTARPLDDLVVTPADERYDAARVAWNLAVDQRSAAVAVPASVEEVVAAVRYARDHGCASLRRGRGTAQPRSGRLTGRCCSRPPR